MNSRRSFLSSLLAAALTPALRFLPAPGKVEPSAVVKEQAETAVHFMATDHATFIEGYQFSGRYLITRIVVYGDSQYSSATFDEPIAVNGLSPAEIERHFKFVFMPNKEG